jgi:hypothetical protein
MKTLIVMRFEALIFSTYIWHLRLEVKAIVAVSSKGYQGCEALRHLKRCGDLRLLSFLILKHLIANFFKETNDKELIFFQQLFCNTSIGVVHIFSKRTNYLST